MTSTAFDLIGMDDYPAYSAAEIERRHGLLAGLAAELELACIVVSDSRDPFYGPIQYFTNWPASTDAFLIHRPADEPTLVVRPYNHIPTASRTSFVQDIVYGGSNIDEMLDRLARMIAEVTPVTGARRIGIIGGFSYAAVTRLTQSLGGVTWVDGTAAYRRWRAILADEEYEFVRVACTMGDAALAALADGVRPGMREYEVGRIVEDAFVGRRCTALMHYELTTSMEDPDGCVPRQQPTSRLIRAGDMLATELSGLYWGYAGQALRTYAVCAEPTPLYRTLHELAMHVYDELVGILRPGVTVGELLDKTDVIEQSGFAIWDSVLHGFGGPALLPPVVRTRSTGGAVAPADPPERYELQENMLVIVQPNVVTRDGRAGVQVGNPIRVRRSGPEVLQRYPMTFGRCGG